MKKYGFREGKARIAHCLSESTAKTLAQRIKAEFPRANVVISECRALCSFYAERGGLLLGFEV
jgi:hypothetical protein